MRDKRPLVRVSEMMFAMFVESKCGRLVDDCQYSCTIVPVQLEAFRPMADAASRSNPRKGYIVKSLALGIQNHVSDRGVECNL